MTIPEFEGILDLKDPKNSKPLEIKPEFEKIFKAEAQLAASAGISLPIAIGIGIAIEPAKFKKDLELVEKPTIMVWRSEKPSRKATEANEFIGQHESRAEHQWTNSAGMQGY